MSFILGHIVESLPTSVSLHNDNGRTVKVRARADSLCTTWLPHSVLYQRVVSSPIICMHEFCIFCHQTI